MLNKHKDVFPEDLRKALPSTTPVEMDIKLKDDTALIIGTMYKLYPKALEEMRKQIKHLLSHAFIRPIISPLGSFVLFNSKKDGSIRMCAEYKSLKKTIIKSNVAMHRIDEVRDQLGNTNYFATLHLRAGCNQIRIKEHDISKTAIWTKYGQFEYFVLIWAKGCFQTLKSNIFRPYLDEVVWVYFDDILI